MTFGGAISNVFRNYANFSGRAKRSEFWYFYLFNTLVWVGIMVLWPIAIVLAPAYALAVMIPNLAVAVRRLHDTNRSGVFLLFAFIPLVGFILLIVWFAEDSYPGPNAYGYDVQYTVSPRSRSAARGGTLGVRCLAGRRHNRPRCELFRAAAGYDAGHQLQALFDTVRKRFTDHNGPRLHLRHILVRRAETARSVPLPRACRNALLPRRRRRAVRACNDVNTAARALRHAPPEKI